MHNGVAYSNKTVGHAIFTKRYPGHISKTIGKHCAKPILLFFKTTFAGGRAELSEAASSHFTPETKQYSVSTFTSRSRYFLAWCWATAALFFSSRTSCSSLSPWTFTGSRRTCRGATATTGTSSRPATSTNCATSFALTCGGTWKSATCRWAE